MTDAALIAKKLAQIDTCLSDLRRLGKPELLDSDIRERRFVEHTLQIAIQAALDPRKFRTTGEAPRIITIRPALGPAGTAGRDNRS